MAFRRPRGRESVEFGESWRERGEGYTKEELIEKCSPIVPRTLPQIFLESDLDSIHIGGADDFISFVKNGFGEKK